MPGHFPLQFLLDTCAGWVNRHQAQVIGYLAEENRVLKKQFGNRCLRLTDHERRRLTAKGKDLGRQLLDRVATNVTLTCETVPAPTVLRPESARPEIRPARGQAVGAGSRRSVLRGVGSQHRRIVDADLPGKIVLRPSRVRGASL